MPEQRLPADVAQLVQRLVTTLTEPPNFEGTLSELRATLLHHVPGTEDAVDTCLDEVRAVLRAKGTRAQATIEDVLVTFFDRFTATAAMARAADFADVEPAAGAEPAEEAIAELEPTDAAEIAAADMPVPGPVPRSASAPAPSPAAAPEVETPDHGEVVTVWFGTNRQPSKAGDPGRGFSSKPEESPQNIHYGTCDVFVPKSHKVGSLGSSSLFERVILGKDDRLRLNAINLSAAEDFWRSVKEALGRCHVDDRHALVFLHGYSCSFKSAALRTAQMAADLKPPGVSSFFSWPSRGNMLGYLLDEARIEASETAITEFLVKFAADVGAKRVHVIAHSMGNLGLLRAMDRILNRAARASTVQFGQVFLAAPDVDVALFKQLAVAYPQLSVRTTIYISPRDWAVRISRLLRWRAARVGFAPPVTVMEGMDTIWVPDFHLDLLGHSYYAKAEGVLNDMSALLRQDSAPGTRQRLVGDETGDGLKYWQMRE